MGAAMVERILGRAMFFSLWSSVRELLDSAQRHNVRSAAHTSSLVAVTSSFTPPSVTHRTLTHAGLRALVAFHMLSMRAPVFQTRVIGLRMDFWLDTPKVPRKGAETPVVCPATSCWRSRSTAASDALNEETPAIAHPLVEVTQAKESSLILGALGPRRVYVFVGWNRAQPRR